MELYAGMDLHSNNTYLGIMENESMRRVVIGRVIGDGFTFMHVVKSEPVPNFAQKTMGL